MRRQRILVADDDTPFARRLSGYLTDLGFDCRTTNLISDAKDVVEFWHPDTVFIDLMLPETNALALFKFIRSKPLKKVPKVIVMSRQTLPQGIETMRRAGAAHYLVKPFAFDEAFRAVENESVVDSEATTVRELYLLNLLLKQAMDGKGDVHKNLHNLMRMIGLKVKALRCSFIQCLNEDTGMVLASNDDENIQGLPIQLAHYPEVNEVRRTLRPLIIQNVRTSDILRPVAGHLARTPFETMAVFPVFCRGRFFGVMSLRMELRDTPQLNYVEKFGQVCSGIISLAIGASPS